MLHSDTLFWFQRVWVAQRVRSLDYLTTHITLTPIRFVPGFVNNKKGCTRLAAGSDKAWRLLAHGRWFSTTKTGRHDIADILQKIVLKHNKSNQIILIPSQPIFALTPSCCVLSREAINISFIVFGLTAPRLKPTIYNTWGVHANHYTINGVVDNLKRGV